jgi:SAM-dependent MidA family methyltransferase
MALPLPSEFALQHSQQLADQICQQIHLSDNWISFSSYMEIALYKPGFGYYAAGSQKFGESGDFVTAPELTPLFAAALAHQIAQITSLSSPHIIEVGAGTGRLAANLLLALESANALPDSYCILELSADLRDRQATLISNKAPHLASRVIWLDCLPENFSGAVIGNELIDAMPVHLVEWSTDGVQEIGVSLNEDGYFSYAVRPASGKLLKAALAIEEAAAAQGDPIPDGYRSEINLAGPAWAASWGNILECGALVLVDYGFPSHEYYLPDRNSGTLMCHYRHHAHPDPFYFPGLQDITAHVNFTALIESAFPAGLELLGFTSQGQFLLNCAILDLLNAHVTLAAEGDFGKPESIKAAAAVNKLVLPQEMGELFKVIVMGKGITQPLLGFRQGDRSHQL